MRETDRAWLALANAHVRVSEFLLLADHFGGPAEIARQTQSRLQKTGLTEHKSAAIANPDTDQIDRGLEWLAGDRHHLITWHSDTCPDLLRQIPSPPLLLYVNGNPDLLHLPALAIVGSRNPTAGGARNAFDFAHHLCSAGFTIVSGLAQGIDSAAHRGAIKAGGNTIAFLGHGIDRIYPAANSDLAHDIAAGGALISEYPLGTQPAKHHFPERNRLISGVSLGTLVVEAARRSGSLITARLAAEQGREVFALPGSIHNPMARGCHELIRQGAKLVETAADIVSELAPLADLALQTTMESGARELPEMPVDDEYAALRQSLGHDPLSADEVAGRSGLTIEQVSSMLLILELRGEVESLPGGRYALLS